MILGASGDEIKAGGRRCARKKSIRKNGYSMDPREQSRHARDKFPAALPLWRCYVLGM
jgi:hypothetical protein